MDRNCEVEALEGGDEIPSYLLVQRIQLRLVVQRNA